MAEPEVKGIKVPDGLLEGFLTLDTVDPNWIWFAMDQSGIIGALTAAPCHGVAMILRVKMDENAPRIALRILLRGFFHDMKERGYKGYMTWFSEDSEDEIILKRIAESNGGMVIRKLGVAVASWFPPEGTV